MPVYGRKQRQEPPGLRCGLDPVQGEFVALIELVVALTLGSELLDDVGPAEPMPAARGGYCRCE